MYKEASMAETSPPPTSVTESCNEEPARGGEHRLDEPRRAPAEVADREGEAELPLASPGGQSEPDSPVAAPFFLLYPGDGGAGFAARPPPQQQQRAWRTPPSPGSPLPFLLLSYPSGGGGKHREWRQGRGNPGGEGPARAHGARGRRQRRGSSCLGAQGAAMVRAPDYLPPTLPRPRASARPGLSSSLGRALTCSRGPRPGARLGEALPGVVEEGAAPRDPAAPLARLLPAPGAAAPK